MKTTTPTPQEMAQHIARFDALQPMAAMSDPDLPLEARDLILSRKLIPVVSPKGGKTPFGAAGIRDRDFSITYAVCPPGTGPGLHAHHRTIETFTVIRGRFRFAWGDAGEHAVELGPLDVLSVPPGVCRGFTNISDEEGVLQVLITGGIHDMNDIAFPPAMERDLAAISPTALAKFKDMGLTFDAGVD